jgi:hypothetical protein
VIILRRIVGGKGKRRVGRFGEKSSIKLGYFLV